MRIKRFAAKNYGLFESYEVALVCGAVGVFGRNGVGKSMFLDGIYGAITNDWHRGGRAKNSHGIRLTAGEKEEAWVEVEVEHGEHQLVIRRDLRRGKTELRVDAEKPITDANKAQAEIDRILGVDRTMLNLYVFKTQDRIYDFIAMEATPRAKAFAVLCRTECCEDLWEMFGKFLSSDAEVNLDVTDNSDELTRELSVLKVKAQELEGKIADETKGKLNANSERTAKEILRRADRLEDLQPRLARHRKDLGEADKLCASLVGLITEAEQTVADCEAAVAELAPEAEKAQHALRSLAQYRTVEAERQRLQKIHQALTKEGQRKLPAPPLKYKRDFDVDGYAAGIRLKEDELARAIETLNVFETDGIVNCPTCGTAVTDLEEHLTELRKQAKILPEKIAREREFLAEVRAYLTGLEAYRRWESDFQARVMANSAAFANHKSLEMPEGDDATWRSTILNHTKAGNVLRDAQQELESVRRQQAGFAAQHQTLDKQVKALEKEITDNTEPEERVQKARQRMAEHVAACQNVARLEGEASVLLRTIKSKEDELSALQVKLARSQRVRRMAAIIRRAREVVHRDRLPRRVAQLNLGLMEDDINTNLGFFGDPFTVETGTDLTYIAHKPGEPPQPATWLSTGQRVVLALSFWPAVASLWSEDLGMLALDEPTANLDEANRSYLAEALRIMTARVRGGRQLIMVTHDPNLRSCFDQVISLG